MAENLKISDSEQEKIDEIYEEQDIQDKNDDIYSIVNYKNNFLIYGGNNSTLYLKDLVTEDTTEVDLDLKDSIIAIKIYKDMVYIVCYDGEVVICKILCEDDKFSLEKYKTFSVGCDVTSFYFSNKNIFAEENNKKPKNNKIDSPSLFLGTKSGQIYYFYDETTYFKMYFAHTTEVLDICTSERNLFSVSDDKIVIFDILSGERILYRESYELRYIKAISDSTYILTNSKNVRIFKNDRMLKKIDYCIDSCVVKDGQIFLGGANLYSILDLNSMRIFEYESICDENLKITRIKILGNILICSSYENIGIGDLRDGKITFYNGQVGGIFDFTVFKDEVIIAGENGLSLISLE